MTNNNGAADIVVVVGVGNIEDDGGEDTEC